MPGREPLDEAAEEQLRQDLSALPVQVGVLRGRWAVEGIEWPYLFVSISAPEDKAVGGRLSLRVEVSNYPAMPTATPWDLEKNEQLQADHRPTGGRATLAFRSDWENGRALYLPIDHVAVNSHSDWPQSYANDIWDPAKGIFQLLDLVHRILNEEADALAVDAA